MEPHQLFDTHGKLRYVCADCERMRNWLLICIRFSSKAAHYAQKTEEREGPQREIRAKSEVVANLTECKSTNLDRITRLEAALNELKRSIVE